MGLPCHGNEKSFSGSRGGREKAVSFRNARGSFLRMMIMIIIIIIMIIIIIIIMIIIIIITIMIIF